MVHGKVARAALLFQALRAYGLRVSQPTENRTYLYHERCATWDGLGGHAIKIRPYVDMALQNNWTFVCNPEDWDTSLHHTKNMGWLWGCNNESSVVGNLASMDSVRHLQWESLGWFFDKSKAKPNKVYKISECRHMPPWGQSWKWYRSQYHLVRKLDPARQEPECWPAEPRRQNVILAIRKGDDRLRAFPAYAYIRLITMLMMGQVPNVTVSNDHPLHMVVISETTEDDSDIVLLRNFFNKTGLASSFLLGNPEKEYDASVKRVVRDLDCMTQSDILMLSESKFSDMAAGCQLSPGISLVLKARSTRNNGLPNAVKVPKNITQLHVDAEAFQGPVQILPTEVPNSMEVTWPAVQL